MRDRFALLFENVILWRLKSFFQLDDQVDIRLYLTEATVLYHSRELASLKTITMYFHNKKGSWLIWCFHYINISD